MQEFKLVGEYIALSSLLKALRWLPSGGVANLIIDDGDVRVNGEQELRRRRKMREGDTVEWEDKKVVIIKSEG